MSISVEWDDEAHTILLYTFTSPWSWDEYRAAIARAWELAKTVDHATDTITDMRSSRVWPKNIFGNIGRSVVEIPESTGTVVLVGGGLFVDMAMNAMRRIYRSQAHKFRTAATIEEARRLIMANRASASPQDTP